MFLNYFSHKLLRVFVPFLLFVYFAKAINNPYKPISKRVVVMSRHGETIWSKEDIFCGWYDSPLTDDGVQEAIDGASLLLDKTYTFDKAYTSALSRARDTLTIMLETIHQKNIPVESSWRLNERHYGELTGQKKKDVAAIDADQCELWRRGYNVLPPPMEDTHDCYKAIHENPAIVDSLREDGNASFPVTESLETTKERIIPYWEKVIKPVIQKGKKVLIVAHGTVLKALVMHIENLSETQIRNFEIPRASPFVYEFDSNMKLSHDLEFLGDQQKVLEKQQQNRLIKN